MNQYDLEAMMIDYLNGMEAQLKSMTYKEIKLNRNTNGIIQSIDFITEWKYN